MIEIKHKFSEEVLHTVEADTLAGAKLIGADLAVGNLGGVDLSGADLDAANLAVAELGGTNLSSANLNGANLTGADLRCAILRGIKMDNKTILKDAKLDGANLCAADLSNVDLSGVVGATTAIFAHSDLRWAILPADLSWAHLEKASQDLVTKDQQLVGRIARGDGNAEGHQRKWRGSAEHTA